MALKVGGQEPLVRGQDLQQHGSDRKSMGGIFYVLWPCY